MSRLIILVTALTSLILLAEKVNGNLQIINGPQSTSVCMNSQVDMPCGFQGADPTSVEVLWLIARQNSRVMTVPANDIIAPTNGLQWVLDVLSGVNDSRNSRLIIGPVGEDDDQSTYQCSIGLPGDTMMISSARATLTVIGPPLPPTVTIGTRTGDSVQIIWRDEESTSCGSTTYHVRLVLAASEQLIIQDTTSNTFYEFTGLSPNVFYTVSVYGSNQAGNGDAVSLNIQTSNDNNNGDDDNSSELSSAGIAGIVIGIVVFTAGVGISLISIRIYIKIKKKEKIQHNNGPNPGITPTYIQGNY